MNKKLTRSTDDAMVAGVAGGIANYLNIDPVLVRLLFVLATLFHGHGLLIYLILMVIVPKETVTEKIVVG